MAESPNIIMQIPGHEFLNRRLQRVILYIEKNRESNQTPKSRLRNRNRKVAYKRRENLLCSTAGYRETSMGTRITCRQLFTEKLRLWLTRPEKDIRS